MKKAIFIGLFFSLLFCAPSFSQEKIVKIDVEGNKLISNATVFSNIKIKVGEPYNENVINEAIKSLISLGYFENVEVQKETTLEGLAITFVLEEKPVLKKITIEGTRRISQKKVNETLELKEGIFLDEFKVKEAIRRVEDLYKRKGYDLTEITYHIDLDKETGEATLAIVIDEKRVVKVRKIVIKGNDTFSDKRIKKLIKTKEPGFLRRGLFKKDLLEDDMQRIKDFYIKEGFGEVSLEYTWDYLDKGVYITIKINEGPRFYIGTITIEGNKDISLEAINELIDLKEGDIFTKEKVELQGLEIQSLYFDRGYIFAQVVPSSYFNPQTKKVDITFKIVENEINYVERIFVRGNQKTKDKVIRRELKIYPGDKFEGEKIKKSRQELENLGFFEEIRFDTEPGTKPNWQDLIVEVKEAKTGYLSFGGGYSSIDEFIGFVEIRQRNFDYANWKTFTGAGQDLSVYASMGSLTQNYNLSFTNPWIFDTPLSFGFDLYRREHDRESDVGYGYQEKIKGGALRFERELNDYLKAGLSYRLDTVEIGDVSDDASSALKAEQGKNDLSTLELSLTRDTRDNVFNPSEGTLFSNSFQVTGGFLGGDKDFLKYFTRLSLYFPMPKKSVLESRVRVGFADPFDDTNSIPIYERFFAGGSNSIRGYRERKVGPIDSITGDPLGGEALFVYNLEYTYPMIDFMKLAVFFDTGNVWANNDDFLSDKLYSSVGLGLRVKTPLGPISIDYGWPLDVEPGEDGKEGRFHFNIIRGF